MAKRQSISKKLRFEVFKRDSFTCQYCGNKAPDVVLEVDHIDPVSKGGKNSILNLITSCFDCNRGKSDKVISDDHVLKKEMEQMEILNQKREQLKMINKWREELLNIDEEQIDNICTIFKKTPWVPNDKGKASLKKLLKKYGYKNLLNAIDISMDQYWVDSDKTIDDWYKMYNKIGGILYLQSQPEERKKISYIKGAARNRFNYFHEVKAAIVLDRYFSLFDDYDAILNWTRRCDNWSHWHNELWRCIEEKEAEE
jgi:hypothetical protein